MTDPWQEGMRAVETEAAGVMSLQIIERADARRLRAAARGGDIGTLRLLKMVAHALQQVENAPRHEPALCGCCPRPLRRDFAVIVVLPQRDNPEHGLTFAICRHCGTTRQQINDAALVALRRMWPETRPISIHEQWGRA